MHSIVRFCQWEDVEAEIDEMGRFVNSKKEQRVRSQGVRPLIDKLLLRKDSGSC